MKRSPFSAILSSRLRAQPQPQPTLFAGLAGPDAAVADMHLNGSCVFLLHASAAAQAEALQGYNEWLSGGVTLLDKHLQMVGHLKRGSAGCGL